MSDDALSGSLYASLFGRQKRRSHFRLAPSSQTVAIHGQSFAALSVADGLDGYYSAMEMTEGCYRTRVATVEDRTEINKEDEQ